MNRGDVVTIAIQGDFGKPRPAVVIQSDIFNQNHPTVTVLLISSKIIEAPIFRIAIDPNSKNGLKKPCQVQVDKAMTIKKEKIGLIIGRLDDTTMLVITRALTKFSCVWGMMLFFWREEQSRAHRKPQRSGVSKANEHRTGEDVAKRTLYGSKQPKLC